MANEFIDFGFRPSLKRHFNGDFWLLEKVFKMPTQAIPAPTLDERRAAVWLGSVSNKAGELPLLAVSIPQGEAISESKHWYAGLMPADAVFSPHPEDYEDIVELSRVVIGFAVYGPGRINDCMKMVHSFYGPLIH